MYLSRQTFMTVVASTPLVSIDFIVRNPRKQVLLGKRINRPAQGYWFVPGGRILKNETMEAAFMRLTEAEFGVSYSSELGRFMGVYEHLYDDSTFDATTSTHYVVLAHEFSLDLALERLPAAQHAEYRWFDVDEIRNSGVVHHNTKAYFTDNGDIDS
ncbi:GDP-mannose mannosyl hydrolase [Marinimicrobium koreense]|uniref:GDP-mannose mannosyl hydrolase n=1 Tax=Marinimicrobium koreense TaxID=306545 RepID=UPI003F6FDA2D